jgi:hypothetical protein
MSVNEAAQWLTAVILSSSSSSKGSACSWLALNSLLHSFLHKFLHSRCQLGIHCCLSAHCLPACPACLFACLPACLPVCVLLCPPPCSAAKSAGVPGAASAAAAAKKPAQVVHRVPVDHRAVRRGHRAVDRVKGGCGCVLPCTCVVKCLCCVSVHVSVKFSVIVNVGQNVNVSSGIDHPCGRPGTAAYARCRASWFLHEHWNPACIVTHLSNNQHRHGTVDWSDFCSVASMDMLALLLSIVPTALQAAPGRGCVSRVLLATLELGRSHGSIFVSVCIFPQIKPRHWFKTIQNHTANALLHR